MSDGQNLAKTTSLACPFLRGNVELTHDRVLHILEGHPDVFLDDRLLPLALLDPDQVRDHQDGSLLFVRRDGPLFVAVAVRFHPDGRPWVVTALRTRRFSKGDVILWTRAR